MVQGARTGAFSSKNTCYQWSLVCDLFFRGTQWANRNCVGLWLNRSEWPERFVIVVQLLSIHVRLFATPWTVAHQAYLSFTVFWCLLTLMSTETVMPSNHLILCCHFLLLPSVFPSIRVFSNESVFSLAGQSIGDSASASVVSMNIQGLFPFGLTGPPSCPRNSQESSPAPWFRSTNSLALSLLYGPTHIRAWLLEKP